MNQAVPLYSVLLILAGAGALYALGMIIRSFLRACASLESSLAALKGGVDRAGAALATAGAGVTQAKAASEANTEALTRLIADRGPAMKDLAEKMIAGLAPVDRLRESLAPAAEELRANMAGVPKLLEMVAKIGQAQLEIAQQQRAEQQERMRNPFGRTNGPMPPRDVAAANAEHEVQQMMRSEGVSREEALLRMNPANTGSVWDGLTEGWR